MKKLARYFLQGIIVLAPIGVTAYVIYLVFTLIDGVLEKYIDPLIPWSIPGIEIISVILVITILGFITSSIVFRPIKRIAMRLLEKAPLLKVIYSAVRDLLSAFVGKEKKFTEPVLVKVNHLSNLEKLGFLTQNDLSVLDIKEAKVAVYFPHSYNFSGELFIVPSEYVTPLNIPSAEVMKFIVSGGVTNIQLKNDKS
jgi:uncharacterized membrane protein